MLNQNIRLKALYTFILLATLAVANAQAVKVTAKTGTEFKIKMTEKRVAIFGDEQEGFAFMGLVSGGIELDGYNGKTLEQTYSKEIEFKGNSLYDRHLGVYHLGNKHYWLYSSFDKKKEECYLYSNEIDVKNGSIALSENPLLVMDQIGEIIKSPLKFFARGSDRYYVNTSLAKNYLSVCYMLKPVREGGQLNDISVGVQVFEPGMKKVWGKVFSLPVMAKAVRIISTAITDKGAFYVLLSHEENGKAMLELLKFEQNTSKPVSDIADLGNVTLRGATLTELKNGGMAFAGIYGQSDRSVLEGFYLYNAANENGKLQRYEFDKKELLKNEKGEKYKSKGSTTFTEVKILNDGGIYLSAEERLTMGNGDNYKYYYDDFFCAKINAAGELQWFKKIPKRQYSLNFEEAVGFTGLEKDGKIVALFSDNEKNDDVEDGQPKVLVAGSNKVALSSVVIDEIGNTVKTTSDIGKTFVHTSTLYKFSGNGYIGITQIGNRTFAPIKITLE